MLMRAIISWYIHARFRLIAERAQNLHISICIPLSTQEYEIVDMMKQICADMWTCFPSRNDLKQSMMRPWNAEVIEATLKWSKNSLWLPYIFKEKIGIGIVW